jgi:hypothetical protein
MSWLMQSRHRFQKEGSQKLQPALRETFRESSEIMLKLSIKHPIISCIALTNFVPRTC